MTWLSDKNWNIKPSKFSINCINPIRRVLENLKTTPNPEKGLIALSIGDPTVFGNHLPDEKIIESMIQSVKSGKFNGYLPSTGCEKAKKAIAEYCSQEGVQIEPNDVIITIGCSNALEMCILSLADEGSNVLIPRPGFPLYKTLCGGLGIETKFYDLRPDRDWKIDIDHLESQIDEKTVAIIYNNPSNPCGSVFSEEHIREVVDVAEKYRLPIIADEIYENMTFPGHPFVPIAALTDQVPVLACRGLTKRYLVPGYRCGWIMIHDKNNNLGPTFRQAIVNLTHRLVGCNSIVQGAIPSILKETPQKFFDSTIKSIKENAEVVCSILEKIPGLQPYMPSGAMYLMLKVDLEKFGLRSDLEFVERLMNEESVFLLPGQCFDIEQHVRLVLTVPQEAMREACERIEAFCFRRVALTNNRIKNSAVSSQHQHLNVINMQKTVTVD